MLWANESGLPVQTPASINSPESIAWLDSLQPDLLVVCDYGQILSNQALETARLGGINLHGSLLPKYRGAAPVQWTILAGDHLAGVSVIHMTTKLDAGPVLQLASTPIRINENADELETRLSQLGVDPTLQAISQLADLPPGESPHGALQSKELATKAPRLSKSDGRLDFQYPIHLVDRQIRGLQPWPGAFGDLLLPNGKSSRLIIHRATPIDLPGIQSRADEFPPGSILFSDAAESLGIALEQPKQWVGIAGVDGILSLELVQLAGKFPMQAKDFAQGYRKQTGLKIEISAEPHSLLDCMSKYDNHTSPTRTDA
jgi:methionyl-tRNA formyltransferase